MLTRSSEWFLNLMRYTGIFISFPPCGWGAEYAHRFPACRMRRLKACPDGSAFTSVGLRRPPV